MFLNYRASKTWLQIVFIYCKTKPVICIEYYAVFFTILATRQCPVLTAAMPVNILARGSALFWRQRCPSIYWPAAVPCSDGSDARHYCAVIASVRISCYIILLHYIIFLIIRINMFSEHWWFCYIAASLYIFKMHYKIVCFSLFYSEFFSKSAIIILQIYLRILLNSGPALCVDINTVRNGYFK